MVTTSTLEDWLWRGDDPIVRDMSWQVYAMWIYRVERPPPKTKSVQSAIQRYVEIEFSNDYKLHGSHFQRLATEFRVPLFEGFTMPPSNRDSETSALFKHLLTRPLSISTDLSVPEDIRLVDAFGCMCSGPTTGVPSDAWASQAFTA